MRIPIFNRSFEKNQPNALMSFLDKECARTNIIAREKEWTSVQETARVPALVSRNTTEN